MPTLRQVHDAMTKYADATPAGRGCEAWRDFVTETREYLGLEPDGEAAANVDADPQYTAFWLAVAARRNPNYEPGTGARRDS
jgi:hypothetical protein